VCSLAVYDLRILSGWRRNLIEDDSDDEGPEVGRGIPGMHDDSNYRPKGPPSGVASGVTGEPCIPSETKLTSTRIGTQSSVSQMQQAALSVLIERQ
jgi:hypothetical protein